MSSLHCFSECIVDACDKRLTDIRDSTLEGGENAADTFCHIGRYEIFE